MTDHGGCAVITLYPDRLRDLWLARFHDDAGVLALFGTDLLPTAFTLRTPGLTVQREVQRLNPQVRVDLFDLDGTTVPGAPPGP